MVLLCSCDLVCTLFLLPDLMFDMALNFVIIWFLIWDLTGDSFALVVTSVLGIVTEHSISLCRFCYCKSSIFSVRKVYTRSELTAISCLSMVRTVSPYSGELCVILVTLKSC